MGLAALIEEIWLELKDTMISFRPTFTGNRLNIVVSVFLTFTFLKMKQKDVMMYFIYASYSDVANSVFALVLLTLHFSWHNLLRLMFMNDT